MKTFFLLSLSLFQAVNAHFDYKPFLEPHVKTPLYGRYAGMSPSTDPRLDKNDLRLAFGSGGISPDFAVSTDWEEAKAWAKGLSGAFAGLWQGLALGREKYDVKKTEIEIPGVDGNQIPLSIYQGTSKTCYYFTHGGGMALMSSRSEPYLTSLNHMSGKHGLTIVAVDFRNYLHHDDENLEIKQFPAGLNDCYSGLEWTYDHKEELGCETIVNFGESGGGNLCLTLSLKTLKEGRPELTDGSFCHCPEAYGEVFSPRTPSMSENNGYFLGMFSQGTQNMMDLYTPDPADKKNPLAWPITAGPEDMKGMKPVMIIVNELDPLRDAGLEMYRNLMAGGVRAEARMVAGTMHARDFNTWAIPGAAGPDYYLFDSTMNAMKSFAAGLRGKILVEADAPPPQVEVEVKPDA